MSKGRELYNQFVLSKRDFEKFKNKYDEWLDEVRRNQMANDNEEKRKKEEEIFKKEEVTVRNNLSKIENKKKYKDLEIKYKLVENKYKELENKYKELENKNKDLEKKYNELIETKKENKSLFSTNNTNKTIYLLIFLFGFTYFLIPSFNNNSAFQNKNFNKLSHQKLDERMLYHLPTTESANVKKTSLISKKEMEMKNDASPPQPPSRDYSMDSLSKAKISGSASKSTTFQSFGQLPPLSPLADTQRESSHTKERCKTLDLKLSADQFKRLDSLLIKELANKPENISFKKELLDISENFSQFTLHGVKIGKQESVLKLKICQKIIQ